MHFRVAVFTDDKNDDLVEKLMAPYDENISVEPYLYRTYEDALKTINNIRNKKEWVLTDEEVKKYNEISDDEAIKRWFGEDNVKENGDVYSTYNPKSKWDYYSEYNIIKPCELPKLAEIDLFPYAYITPDGVWHAPGEVGWFSSSESEEEWNKYQKELKDYCDKNSNLWIHWIDCHI